MHHAHKWCDKLSNPASSSMYILKSPAATSLHFRAKSFIQNRRGPEPPAWRKMYKMLEKAGEVRVH